MQILLTAEKSDSDQLHQDLSNSDYHLGESMFNSVRTTTLSIILIVLFSFIVGYILARVHFKGNRGCTSCF